MSLPLSLNPLDGSFEVFMLLLRVRDDIGQHFAYRLKHVPGVVEGVVPM